MLVEKFKIKLKDGTDVSISAVDPCDKKCLIDGLDRLSARSRYQRFFSPVNNLSEAQLTHLTDVDNVNHVLITASETTGEDSIGIGLARYIRLKQESDVAELAVSVTDDYQGRGAGSILLDTLIEHAKANHIRILRGYVLKSNKSMIRLFKRRDADCIVDEDGSLRFDLHINL